MKERIFYSSALSLLISALVLRGLFFGFSVDSLFSSVNTHYYDDWLGLYLPFTQSYGLFLFMAIAVASILVTHLYEKVIMTLFTHFHDANMHIMEESLQQIISTDRRTAIYRQYGVSGPMRVWVTIVRLVIVISLMLTLVAPFAGYWPFSIDAIFIIIPLLLLLWFVKYLFTHKLFALHLHNSDLIGLLTISLLGLTVLPAMIALYLFTSMVLHSLIQQILNTQRMGTRTYATKK
jgi:hypothetical protein